MSSPNLDIQSLIADQVSAGIDSGLAAEEIIDQILAGTSKRHRVELGKKRVEEERREREEGIRYYEPYAEPSGYQLDFHKSTKKRKLIIKTNRGGGTTSLVADFIWWCTKTHPYRETRPLPIRARICCVDFENGIEKIILPKFREMVKREDLLAGDWETSYSKEHRRLSFAKKYGSFIEFMSCEQDPEKFGGVERDVIGEDEPIPSNIHDENLARLVAGGEMIIDFTPANLNARTSWLFDLWKRVSSNLEPMWDLFFFDIRNNVKAYTKQQVDDFVSSFTNESERLARAFGKFPQLSGLIYKNFSRVKHVVKPFEISSERGSIYVSIDPHMRKATGVIFGYVDRNGDKYIWDELLVKGTAKVIVDLIKIKLGNRKLALGIMDDSSKSPNEMGGERSIWEEFLDPDRDRSNRGISCMTVSGKQKDVRTGIRLVEDHLGLDEIYQKPRLFVFENCVGTIHEFETYMYDDYKFQTDRPILEKPRKVDDDLMDCVRYWLMSNPYHSKTKFVDPSTQHQYSKVTGEIIG